MQHFITVLIILDEPNLILLSHLKQAL